MSTKQELITGVSAGFVGQQGMLTKLSLKDLEWIVDNSAESTKLFIDAVKNRKSNKIENLLWQNGPHKVVTNDDGTISAWIDCDQIDWLQSNQNVLIAAGRILRTNSGVVVEMPKGNILKGVVEVIFRNFGCAVTCSELSEKFTYDHPMISPYFLAKINEIFPSLANEYLNGTQWKDSGENWCFEVFYRWYDERRVGVDRLDDDWCGNWWFPSLRKIIPQNSVS